MEWQEATSGCPHFVYRVFDGDKTVYIGCTGNPHKRAIGLRARPWWTPDMTPVIVAQFANRRAAYRYENILIRAEQPTHNVQGTSRKTRKAAA